MKKSEIINILNESIEGHKQVHIVRKDVDNNPIACIPLTMVNKLLLIQNLCDFYLDGYKIIRVKDISEIRSDECERFSEFILKEEGIFNKICVPFIITFGDWRCVLDDLMNLNRNIIVECEKNVGGEFYIGKIINFNNKLLSLLCFNAVGKWDDVATEIYYRDITSINFDDRYTSIISKYIDAYTTEENDV